MSTVIYTPKGVDQNYTLTQVEDHYTDLVQVWAFATSGQYGLLYETIAGFSLMKEGYDLMRARGLSAYLRAVTTTPYRTSKDMWRYAPVDTDLHEKMFDGYDDEVREIEALLSEKQRVSPAQVNKITGLPSKKVERILLEMKTVKRIQLTKYAAVAKPDFALLADDMPHRKPLPDTIQVLEHA